MKSDHINRVQSSSANAITFLLLHTFLWSGHSTHDWYSGHDDKRRDCWLKGWRWKWTKPMSKGGFPNFVDVEDGAPTLIHIPTFQSMNYSCHSPSTHHPPWQPILPNQCQILVKVVYRWNFKQSSVKFCYLTRMDVLYRWGNGHCWGGVVNAVTALVLWGELGKGYEPCPLACLQLLFLTQPISHHPYLLRIWFWKDAVALVMLPAESCS